jgi:hypothetical protein
VNIIRRRSNSGFAFLFAALFALIYFASPAQAVYYISTIDSTGDVGTYSSIAVDSNNKVYISYIDNSNHALKYATNASGSWVTITLECSENVGGYTSIAIDSNNKVHISYYDQTNGDLKYATNESGAWVVSIIIDSSGNVGEQSSIAIDSNNKVHISYLNFDNQNLKYATNASGLWVTSIIDPTGYVGTYSSIAVDSNNKVHISNYDKYNGTLRYVTNTSGLWQIFAIDRTGNVGGYTSIAIDSNNKVHISYYDWSNRNLKYATNASGSWVTSTVDSTGDVGTYSSIAINVDGGKHISYYDATNGDLKYAYQVYFPKFNLRLWEYTTVDTGNVGQSSSLAFGSNGAMHISYYDATNHALKYATDYCPKPNAPSQPSPANNATGVSTTPTLSWSAVSGADSYTLQVCNDSSCLSSTAYAAGIASNQWTVSPALNGGTQYWWRVWAGNSSCGSGPSSAIWKFTTCTTPATPMLTSPANGATGVSTTPTLSWSAVSGAVSYTLQVCSDSNCTNVVATAGIASNQWTVSSALSANTKYYWRARANNSCGPGSWSGTRYLTTASSCTLPGIPTLVSPANGATGVSTTPTLSWSAVSGTTSYDVQVCSDSACATVLSAVTTYNQSVLSALSANTKYYWRARANNSCGPGSWSGTSNFTTASSCTLPGIPTLVSPANGAPGVSTTPTLSWSAVSGTTSYDVQVCSDIACAIPVRPATVAGNQWVVLPALNSRAIYYWRTRATNACGPGAWSVISIFATR